MANVDIIEAAVLAGLEPEVFEGLEMSTIVALASDYLFNLAHS